MFEAFELNTVLRALTNEYMRLKMSCASEDITETLGYLIRKTHDAILASTTSNDQVDFDDARAVYDFWMEVETGESKPAFVE